MKQQLPSGLGEREVAEFIENNEVETGKVIGSDRRLREVWKLRLFAIEDGRDALEVRRALSVLGRDQEPELLEMIAGLILCA
ncbi:hypothetical protein [Rhizobium sp. CNPSo 3490]|uniref:hypothetical protein n=1 Tax=unclassified Rhizobium TaxID=2613769 RepID=UPI00255053D8|nr:hypothetical protein [Rhizobium sp. CNPSo 3490]MDK4735077.1 hypothetical protein [Rhizobium sp. CNPSo 3490]